MMVYTGAMGMEVVRTVGCILKEEPLEFDRELVLECERKGGVKADSRVFA